jgi:hypothetical protein
MNKIEVKNLLRKRLGLGDVMSDSQIQYKCVNPRCKSHDKGKKKFSVNLGTGQYNCWVCSLKGRNYSDLSNLLRLPELNIVPHLKTSVTKSKELSIPEHTNLSDLPRTHRAWLYLTSRGISEDVVLRYRIGFDYNRNGIFIPSYDLNGNINYWVTRYITPHNDDMRYTAARVQVPILFEDMLDFNRELIGVEGSFDVMSVDYNATYFAGSFPSKLFIDRCKKHNTPVVLVFDGSAYDKTLKYAALLASKGVEVSYVKLPKHLDPNEMGGEVLAYIQKNKVRYAHETYFINLLKSRL